MNDKAWTITSLLVTALVLMVVYGLAAAPAENRRTQLEEDLRQQLLASDPTANVVETRSEGYGGVVVVWSAVAEDGTIRGISIRDLRETWGLGRRALRDQGFLQQFLGTRGYAEVGRNVEALSGATVTSKAVAKAVNEASVSVTGEDGLTAATEWGD